MFRDIHNEAILNYEVLGPHGINMIIILPTLLRYVPPAKLALLCPFAPSDTPAELGEAKDGTPYSYLMESL